MTAESTDLYTPWREPHEVLEARHVGRADELRALIQAVQRYARGAAPVPVYIFGPRGAGKSHLIALLDAASRSDLASHDVGLTVISEDIPELRTAEALLMRIDEEVSGRSWMDWGQPVEDDPVVGRHVLIIEGFDRQLAAMSKTERQKLRHEVVERELFIIATGVSLSESLVGRNAAFYNTFDAWPLLPLDDTESGELLDKLVRERPSNWGPRRKALVALAGGNCRALIALGRACAANPDDWATDDLFRVLQNFTAHYQMRYRDLPPSGQQIVEVLARAPREMTPTEIAEAVRSAPVTTSVQCRRLLDDGVVLLTAGRHSGAENVNARAVLYRLAEPLFRFWLEYRNGDWDATRIRWLGELLRVLLTDDEIARMGVAHRDLRLQSAARGVPVAAEARWRAAAEHITSDLPDSAAVAADLADTLDEEDLDWLLHRLLLHSKWAASLSLHNRLEDGPLSLALDYLERIESGGSPRAEFSSALAHVHASGDTSAGTALGIVLSTHPACRRRWKLPSLEMRLVARTPALRAWLMLARSPFDWRLNPEDVLPSDSDVGLLVNVAAAKRDTSLLARALTVLSAAGGTLHNCLNPGAKIAVPDPLCNLILEDPSTDSLTWLGFLSEVSESAWLSAMSAPKNIPSTQYEPDKHEVPLMALAVRSPNRLKDLSERLGKTWQQPIRRASALAHQLAEYKSGALHPELEQIRQLIET